MSAFDDTFRALAQVRTRDLTLPPPILEAYLAHTWHSRKKINAGWMGWSAALNAVCSLFSPFIAHGASYELVVGGRAAITTILALGALIIYLMPRHGREGIVITAATLGVVGVAAFMTAHVNHELAERYVMHVIFMCGTAIVLSRMAWRDTVMLGGSVIVALTLLMAFTQATSLSTAEKIQMTIFFDVGLIGLMLGKRAMEKLNYRVFVLSANERMKMRAIEEMNGRLHALARTDPLTAVSNRRHFDETFGALRLSANPRKRAALLMIDIDFFKRLNDTQGHEAGDECLKIVAALIQSQLRAGEDFLARFGGEEFVAVLPNVGREEALAAAERVRSAVERRGIPNPTADFEVVTVSVGVSVMPPCELDLMIAEADAALYEAKSSGRNRVCIAAHAPGLQVA